MRAIRSPEDVTLVDKRLKESTGLLERRDDFKKKAGEVGKSLAGLALKIGLRAASVGIIESAHIKELETIAAEISSDVSKAGAGIIEKRIETAQSRLNRWPAERWRDKMASLTGERRQTGLLHLPLSALHRRAVKLAWPFRLCQIRCGH